MAIAAGFRVVDGVVLCADTEHSSDYELRHAAKMWQVDCPAGKCVFAYAGHSPLAEAVIRKCWQKINAADPSTVKNPDDIADIVENVVDVEYHKHAMPLQDEPGGSVYQLLFAAWTPQRDPIPTGATLFSTWQGTVSKCDYWECTGTGSVLGSPLIASLFDKFGDIRKARIAAAYVVGMAKKYAAKVSGSTHIVSLDHEGSITPTPWSDTEPIQDALLAYESESRTLMLSLAGDLVPESFAAVIDKFGVRVNDLRPRFGLESSDQRIRLSGLLDDLIIRGELPSPARTKADSLSPQPSHSGVVYRNALCEGLQVTSPCPLKSRYRAMNHEGCACADYAFLCAQIDEHGNR